MEEFIVRKAVTEDADQIAVLLKELGYPNTPAFVQLKIVDLSESNNDTVLIAEVDGKVVGLAHLHIAELFHEPGRLGRIMAIVITNNYRRLGIGRKLMTLLEAIARNVGCIKLEVTSGTHRNDAHPFYRSLGYIETPKRFVKVLK